eukprot:jgi/Botrbrau1/15633/Bobra.4_1s0018.1
MAIVHDFPDPKFDPFRRTDKYGVYGQEPQPWWEYLRLGILSITVLPLKFFGALSCIVGFYLVCRFQFLLPKERRSDIIAEIGKIYCRACLFCLGFVHIKWQKLPLEQLKGDKLGSCQHVGVQPVGVVSNHMGYCDILIHMANTFPSFVARGATKDLIMIGLISQNMGCIYVDREKAAGAKGVSGLVKDRMVRAAQGAAEGERPMLLFPEGTTTNGKYFLPFKTGAFLAGAPVQPYLLKYGKGAINPSWETIPATWHIFLMLCNPLHSVTVTEFPVYVPNEAEKKDPVLFAKNVHDLMLANTDLIESNSTIEDKWEYHALIKDQLASTKKAVKQE